MPACNISQSAKVINNTYFIEPAQCRLQRKIRTITARSLATWWLDTKAEGDRLVRANDAVPDVETGRICTAEWAELL
jgi:hypothetical protein